MHDLASFGNSVKYVGDRDLLDPAVREIFLLRVATHSLAFTKKNLFRRLRLAMKFAAAHQPSRDVGRL